MPLRHAQLGSVEQHHRLAEDGGGEVTARISGVVRICPARFEVGGVAGQRLVNGGGRPV
jgi:hypothetical protein